MLRQILVGTAVSVCNMAIHAFLMAAVIWAAYIAGAITLSRQSLRLITVMIATVSFLMAGHFAEVLVWSLAYAIVGAAPKGRDLIYFAFVNYTTLGYRDLTPVERWQLLGPMTAMNGVLLFGWSTAVIFEVLGRALMTIRSEEDIESNVGVSREPMDRATVLLRSGLLDPWPDQVERNLKAVNHVVSATRFLMNVQYPSAVSHGKGRLIMMTTTTTATVSAAVVALGVLKRECDDRWATAEPDDPTGKTFRP